MCEDGEESLQSQEKKLLTIGIIFWEDLFSYLQHKEFMRLLQYHN